MIESELLKTAIKRWKATRESKTEKAYRELTKKSLAYFTGSDQGWDEGGDRAKLAEKKMPALTLNRIAPIIRLIMGARPNTEATFTAVEEGDVETASILRACKDHVDNLNRWHFMEDDWFRDGMILNRAVAEIVPDYSEDIRGEVGINLYPGDEFYFGPSKKKDRSDMDYMFRQVQVSPDVAKRLFPGFEAKINELVGYTEGSDVTTSRDSGEADEYNDPQANYYDKATNKLSLVYYYYKEYKTQTKLYDLFGDEPTVFDSSKSVEEVKTKLKKIGLDNRFKVVPVEYIEVKYLIFCHEIELETGENPWNRQDGKRTKLSDNFWFVAFEPERLFHGATEELISLIIPGLEDPQKFHNKLASAILHIIGTQAHSGYDYEKGAIDSTNLKKVKEHGSEPGHLTEWEKGALSRGKVVAKQPGAPPMGHMAEAKQMAQDLLDISGAESLVNLEALGKSASGKAIDLKQRQGGNIISWIYKSFRFFQHVLTEYTRDAIQVLYDYEKTVRITGQKTRYVRINEQVFDYKGVIVDVLNNTTVGKYDVVITDKEVMPTERIERFRMFIELVKSGALPIPPPVMLAVVTELLDDPNLKEIIEENMGEYMEMMREQPGMEGQTQ